MARFQDKTAVLDEKLKLVTTSANKIHYITAYVAGDNYATVTGNSVANADVVVGNWTLADQGTNGRKATLASVNGTATSTVASGTGRHLALVNSTSSTVLHVTEETTGQAVTSGNTVTFQSVEIRENQPVAP